MDHNTQPTTESDYTVTHQTEHYEVGVKGGEIIAACKCGDGVSYPDKGMGRAFVAAWRTRHQHITPPGEK